MKHGQRRALQTQNMKRLTDLGLPSDFFSPDFKEREALAKLRELALLAEFERRWLSGQWSHMSLPFEQIIERWRAEIADPMHFASIGTKPRWKKALTTAEREWRRVTSGDQRTAWREYRRRQIAKKREAQGKPPSTWRV